MKYSKEVKTALLAIVAILMFIFGYSFLKGKNWFEPSRTFYAVYEDVEGLSPSSPVTINGYQVGHVTDIGFLDRSGRLIVTFNVETDFPFSKNSTAQIYGGGLIGGKSLGIVPEYEPGNVAQSGDTLPGEIEEGLLELVNERLSPLQQKVEQAIVSTDSLVNAFNQVMNPTTRNKIIQTIEDLNATVASLRTSAGSVNRLVTNNSDKLDRSLTNLDELTANLRQFSDTLNEVDVRLIVDNLEKVSTDFERISQKINNGEGTAARLINDPTVYENLERATRQLDELVRDVKLNPKRYVHFSIFGRNPGPYSPPRDSL